MAKATDSANQTVHAFDFLRSPPNELPQGVCVVFGNQRFLKLLVLKAIDGMSESGDNDFANSRFDGDPGWPVVMDELNSQSLFGGGKKRIVIDEADEFVKTQRDRLEALVQERKGLGTLILVVGTWAANTRLYKFVNKDGLQIQCDIPQIKRGSSSTTDESKLNSWLTYHAKSLYQLNLAPDSAKLLCDFAEMDLGRVDSDLAKLALYLKPNDKVSQDHVRQFVGGWRSQTMWEASDAMTAGKTRDALVLIDRLLKAGEHPLALYGQLSWSLRRYPKAMEIYDRLKESSPKPSVADALIKAGFRTWSGEVPVVEANLRRLGRPKVEQLGSWLLLTDLALKGSHSRDDRARLAIEKLAVWLGQSTKSVNASN